MGNYCCAAPVDPSENRVKAAKKKKGKKPNPFTVEYNRTPNAGVPKLVVLENPTGRDIGSRYELGNELGRGEFGITHLCTDKETGEKFACKSISRRS
ncbi:hypothetical protein HPP92_009586 [Vanilla planifolia]|uniref:Uncharacterized protein n=1 Tax=Vanilla planifolia TaxID=51239 RepID=A0A835RG04_VANPL|nr:hypothetical protein HPP92_009586 [Vanilla planifolia]